MPKIKNIMIVCMTFTLGWCAGVVWHKFWLPPLPQVSALRQAWSHTLPSQFRPLTGKGRKGFVADEIAGHIRMPNFTVEHAWPEHPKGMVRIVSNASGFREDADTPIQKPEGTYRILVTGDSHTDGVVENSESFSNLLEVRLNAEGDKRYEVINGGTGIYGPYNYEGFLRKHLGLKPDLFIVMLFSGNDFTDAIRTSKIRGYLHYPDRRPKGYFRSLGSASKIDPGALAQSLNQIFFFEAYPQLIKKAVPMAILPFRNIQELCEERGIGFLVLTLPTRMDILKKPEKSEGMRAAKSLNLSAERLALNREMVRSFLEQLDALSIAKIDLTPSMEQRGEELFWRRDHHLNHRGHQLVADILYQHLGTLRDASTSEGSG